MSSFSESLKLHGANGKEISECETALLLINSKVRNIAIIHSIVQPGVRVLTYQHEDGLQGILRLISHELGVHKVKHIGFFPHSTHLWLCVIVGVNKSSKSEPIILSPDSVESSKELRNFLHYIVAEFLNKEHPQSHIDFFCCSAIATADASDLGRNHTVSGVTEIASKLSSLLGVGVGSVKGNLGN